MKGAHATDKKRLRLTRLSNVTGCSLAAYRTARVDRITHLNDAAHRATRKATYNRLEPSASFACAAPWA
jgi:hypothetical protein